MTNKTKDSTVTRTHQLIINGKPATDAEYARVMNAKPKATKPVSGSLSSNRGFSLLR